MAKVKLNGVGRSYADALIASGKVDKTSSWSFSAQDGNDLLGSNGDDWANYGKHHLGVDTDQANDTKAHYSYPFAKAGTLYRSALTAIRQRAGQEGATDIYDAAGTMLSKIDDTDGNKASARLRMISGGKDKPKCNAHYKMSAKNNRGEIYLYGVIGDSFFSDGITANQFSQDLKALGNVSAIDLRINSEGGDVFQGRTIYNLLSEHPAKIYVSVDGLAASIASLIAMAGDEISMGDGTFMMIHNPWGFAMGDSREMNRVAALLDSVRGTMIDTYAARTKQSRDDISSWLDAETWMTAAQAKERGFADKVAEPVRVAASVAVPQLFSNLPEPLRPRRSAAQSLLARGRALLPKS